ncbi:MAG: hypothetical protein NZ949_01505, partial [Candidatus Kapabacteria bacterium]|nr:hypothetical protein [Candidatus Kapabacteria bacterium]MDW7997689.1 hypothetical protein [Bacteroidota bacterium]
MQRRLWWTALPAVVVTMAQEPPEVCRLVELTAQDSVFCLDVPFVQSLTVRLDSVYLLQTPLDYELNARCGCVRLSPYFRRLFRYRDTLQLWISARYVPLFVHPRGKGLPEGPFSSMPAAIRTPPRLDTLVSLKPRGRLVRGFTVQTGSGFLLHSGIELDFRTHLVGQTEVGGLIAASHMPLQSQGSSITLQEVDQLSLHVRSPGFVAELGELSLSASLSPSHGIDRVHGVRTTAQIGAWEAVAVLGSSRAVITTVTLQGMDGVPGPYRLRGVRSGGFAHIVPGSERVWVNGVLQERGEDKDYVIDYARAELTFRPRCPINSTSRVVVEFSCFDGDSPQTLGLLGVSGAIAPGHHLLFGYTHRMVTPLQDTPWGAQILVYNGEAYALGDGASLVGLDSVSGRGLGSYRKRDTVVGGVPCAIWEYAPGAPDALYVVEFSPVGEGRGDYKQVAPTIFRYVGQGRGDYAPVKLLSLPARHQLWTLRWKWDPADLWSSEVRLDYSRFQPHRRYSEVLSGVALSLRSRYSIRSDTTATPLWWENSVEWATKGFPEHRAVRMRQQHFAWEPLLSAEGVGEKLRMQQRVYLQVAPLQVQAVAGWIRSDTTIAALWWEASTAVLPPADSSSLKLSYAGGKNSSRGLGRRDRWHQAMVIGSIARPRWRWVGEIRWRWQKESENFPQSQQRYAEGKLGVVGRITPSVEGELQLPWRWQWEPLFSQWWQPSLWLRWRSSVWSSQVCIGWNAVRQTGAHRNFPLLLWQGLWKLPQQGSAQWRYESGAELTGVFLPLFLRVLPGQGNYRYKGDSNANGAADASE